MVLKPDASKFYLKVGTKMRNVLRYEMSQAEKINPIVISTNTMKSLTEANSIK